MDDHILTTSSRINDWCRDNTHKSLLTGWKLKLDWTGRTPFLNMSSHMCSQGTADTCSSQMLSGPQEIIAWSLCLCSWFWAATTGLSLACLQMPWAALVPKHLLLVKGSLHKPPAQSDSTARYSLRPLSSPHIQQVSICPNYCPPGSLSRS